MPKKVLITGGCGFIGTNAAKYYLNKEFEVIVFDNLSRVGARENLEWLKTQGPVQFVKGDIRNIEELDSVFEKYKPDYVLHLAAQVTMVDSIKYPKEDFEVNAMGTFNVLDAARRKSSQSILLYPSTNKVYGEMKEIEVEEKEKRYGYKNIVGIDENQKLDFHGPYGCSKGTGDQYFLDFARIYGLKTIVFRQSGIYGPHQFGIEEQGWLAWFANALIFNKPVTIFGDGKQVRDILYIDDLIKAYDMAIENIEKTKGQVYNIGGGNFSLSILELFDILENITNNKLNYSFGEWRQGDQRVYISNTEKAKKDFGWTPKISPKEGVEKLYKWIYENAETIKNAGVFK